MEPPHGRPRWSQVVVLGSGSGEQVVELLHDFARALLSLLGPRSLPQFAVAEYARLGVAQWGPQLHIPCAHYVVPVRLVRIVIQNTESCQSNL